MSNLFLFLFVISSLPGVFLNPLSSSDRNTINFADIPCGKVHKSFKRNEHRDSRIVGGKDAVPGEYPWSASILGENGRHLCGGFAISKRFILTAAHCFTYYIHGVIGDEDIQKMTVVLGVTNLTDYGIKGDKLNANALRFSDRENELIKKEQVQSISINKVLSHVEFSHFYPDFENDIALIKLEKDITWNSRVQPVCVSSQTLNEQIKVDSASVAGWGLHEDKQSENEWKHQITLKKISGMPIWKNSDCKKAYEKLGKTWNTKDSHVCAGYHDGRADACKGDSGSALTVENKESGSESIWTAIGLDSGGDGCSKPGIPGIYTRLSHFVPWIQRSMQQLSQDD